MFSRLLSRLLISCTLRKPLSNRFLRTPSKHKLRSTVHKPMYIQSLIEQQQEARTHVLLVCSAGIYYVVLYVIFYSSREGRMLSKFLDDALFPFEGRPAIWACTRVEASL